MRPTLAALAALPPALLFSTASAFDGMCRSPSDAAALPNASRVESSIGAPTEMECFISTRACTPIPFCKDGLESARGVWLGEHRYLTSRAYKLANARFQGRAIDIEGPGFAEYYSDGTVYASFGISYEPAPPGNEHTRVSRDTAISEFSDLADNTYSLSDFILGNERCFAPCGLQGSLAASNECHGYGSHLGPLNSLHFSPQNKAAYELYHGIALSIAARCRAMSRIDSTGPTALVKSSVNDCVREALVFQSMAAHYLEDAWSSGHMWERWGSPVFAAGSWDGRLRQATLGLFSGIIHGWRSVVRSSSALRSAVRLSETIRFWQDFQHDQLCKAGPFTQSEDEAHRWVEWAYPEAVSADATKYAAAGDLYLLPSTAGPFQSFEWNLDRGLRLTTQRTRLLSCVGVGFREVADAFNGTTTATPLLGSATEPADPAITRSLDPLCFGARVTNRSFCLGLGVGEDRFTKCNNDLEVLSAVTHFLSSRLFARLVPLATDLVASGGALPTDLVSTLETVMEQVVSPQLAADLQTLAFRAALRTREAPDATDLARLRGADDSPITAMGFLPNSAYVPLVTNDQVPYLELHDPAKWSSEPTGAGAKLCATAGHALRSVGCTSDLDCTDGTYCERGTRVIGGAERTRYCVRHETAILRAYRNAELPYWCAHDTWDDFESARKSCSGLGRNDQPECTSCAALLAPHIRSACNQALYRPRAGGFDHRSACDALKDAGLVTVDLDPTSIHAPLDAGEMAITADPYGAAMALCLSTSPIPKGSVDNCPSGQSCCRKETCATRDDCPSRCIDTKRSAIHCGACGNTCLATADCCGGRCGEPLHPIAGSSPTRMRVGSCCGYGLDDVCISETIGGSPGSRNARALVWEAPVAVDGGMRKVDTASDPAFCGPWAGACPPDQTCCFRACVDVRGDFRHCGACGNACRWNEDCCNGTCVLRGSSEASCDGCNRPCGPYTHCILGTGCWTDGQPYPNECGDPKPLQCSGVCFPTDGMDPCGACGVHCQVSEYCCGGRCIPFAASGGRACSSEVGATCGVSCAPGEPCVDGLCRSQFPGCGAPYRYCQQGQQCDGDGGCYDPLFTNERCGGQGACPAGNICCNGVCVDPQRSDQHCGGCYAACLDGARCCGGRCGGADGGC